MPADPPPAEFEVTRLTPDGRGTQSIYACAAHVAHTLQIMLNGAAVAAVKTADPALHGCKGHQERWPVPSAPG